MKRIIAIIFATLLILSLTIASSASNAKGNVILFDKYTVEFSADSIFCIEKQEYLANCLVGYDDNDESSTTYNLLCTLLGHKTTTESVTVIEHCVRDTQPRCYRTIQELTVCTRCEEIVDTNIISEVNIYCCD